LWMAEEQRLLDNVDVTIAVSPELARAKSAPGRQVALVENAVDFDTYRDASAAGREPAEYAAIPRPRLGYSGLIGKRLDLELLTSLARHRVDWSIVLVGRVDRRDCESELAALERLDNVYFLGCKDVSDVPHYVAGFDIGLLPYRRNLETRNISPLKLFEYAASGKPVIATDIPAAQRHEAVVSIARTVDEFVRLCDRYLASTNTWDDRVREISALLHGAMKGGAR